MRSIPWAEFRKQLDPIEEGAWGLVVSTARDTGIIQEVRIGPTRYAVAPSGRVIVLASKSFTGHKP